MDCSEIKEIKLDSEQLKEFLDRVEKRLLIEKDYDVIKSLIQTIVELSKLLSQKNINIEKLKHLLFGEKTEKIKNIIKNEIFEKKTEEKKTVKGHGRNGSDKYTGARIISVGHNDIKTGDICEKCNCGKLYIQKKPGIFLKLWANPIVQCDKYELERFRCNACGYVFTAAPPDEAGTKKYDESVAVIISLLKYGSGFPFYRLMKLQESFGIPMPVSTQWDLIEEFADEIYKVHDALINSAAQGKIIHNDDTTNKILSMISKDKENKKLERKGIFTTGIISRTDEFDIALFFTGNKHAGENFSELLSKRKKKSDEPIQMCDALSRNYAKDFNVIIANCLTHGRRNFVDVYDNFKEQCGFVIEILGSVYNNDSIARDKKMTPAERLLFHQEKSGHLMENLKKWLIEQFEKKLAEQNSGLGKAISYMLNHWEKLTMFLKKADVPLDNNICERALKKVVLHRKNSYFYKTENGAYIGDIFMSLIQTCEYRV